MVDHGPLDYNAAAQIRQRNTPEHHLKLSDTLRQLRAAGLIHQHPYKRSSADSASAAARLWNATRTCAFASTSASKPGVRPCALPSRIARGSNVQMIGQMSCASCDSISATRMQRFLAVHARPASWSLRSASRTRGAAPRACGPTHGRSPARLPSACCWRSTRTAVEDRFSCQGPL